VAVTCVQPSAFDAAGVGRGLATHDELAAEVAYRLDAAGPRRRLTRLSHVLGKSLMRPRCGLR
jgi:hypothetical protein